MVTLLKSFFLLKTDTCTLQNKKILLQIYHMEHIFRLFLLSIIAAFTFVYADAESSPKNEAFDAQSVLEHYLIDGTLTSADGYTAEQKSYQKGAYVYQERTWVNGDESLNIITYNQQIKKFQEWGFYPWGTFYAQGEWNEARKTMFYHTEEGQPTAKLIFNDDSSVSLEMLNLNNGDFFIWTAKIVPSE